MRNTNVTPEPLGFPRDSHDVSLPREIVRGTGPVAGRGSAPSIIKVRTARKKTRPQTRPSTKTAHAQGAAADAQSAARLGVNSTAPASHLMHTAWPPVRTAQAPTRTARPTMRTARPRLRTAQPLSRTARAQKRSVKAEAAPVGDRRRRRRHKGTRRSRRTDTGARNGRYRNPGSHNPEHTPRKRGLVMWRHSL